MISISVDQISALDNISFQGEPFALVKEICYDSRKIRNASSALFIALVTERNNGHRFIQDAYRAGIRMFLVSEFPEVVLPGAGYAIVRDTLFAVQELAIMHRQLIQSEVVGITGSNGKTVVKEWLYACLQGKAKAYRSPRSYNSQLGVALSVLNVPTDADPVILEAGISQEGEMDKLVEMIAPSIGIFTNLLSAHAENFSSRETHLKEKLRLFKQCKRLICSSNYPEIIETARNNRIEVFSWGFRTDDSIQILKSTLIDKFTELHISYQGKQHQLIIPAQDSASVENAMHVVAFLFQYGLTADEVKQRISHIQPKEMRMETITGIHNCLIINDTWSADMHSLQIGLETLALQPYSQRTLIVSDLPESGINPVETYRTLANLAAEKGINRIIGVGEQISRYASLFHVQKDFYLSTEELLDQIPSLDFRDECILLKGARMFRFERIATQLQEKKHETVLEVNLSSLIDNLNYYRAKAGLNVKTMAMVKAFAYGSGSLEIARTLQFHGIDYLAVAYADEGVVLRKAGITCPILVLSPETDSLNSVLEYNLEPELYSFRMLGLLLNSMKGADLDQVTVQIKLDTGMHRLGFSFEEIEKLIDILKAHPEIKVSGIFSHLAASEDPNEDEFTRLQIERFKSWSAQIQFALGYPVFRHILNSSGISRFPEAAFEMVRLGIGLYGIGNASEQRLLKDVSCLKTTVSQIHELEPGETVGYGRKGVIARSSKIAILPIGYADGFLRSLGNGRATVKIKGQLAPTIGQICMDMCMVDITEIEHVSEGDEAIVFENAGDIRNLAENLGTIPYEVLTGISQRVKRVYIEN